MRHLRLIYVFMRASVQQEMAYRINFFISALYSVANLLTGVLGLTILFEQVETLQGWTLPSALALLGVYLTVGALRGLFIEPSMDALAGLGGEVWTGNFDFTLLRPVDTQFLTSVRLWRPFALLDLAFGIGVLLVAASQLNQTIHLGDVLLFMGMLACAVTVLYAILLIFTALIFWSPGFFFTWVFNSLFQMARYPVQVYPAWLRWVLTWIIPVGIMTTIPSQALTGTLSAEVALGVLGLSIFLLITASALFRAGLTRYAGASS